MTPSDFLMFHRPSLGREEEENVLEVLRSGWLTTGSKTKEFERRFAEYRGTRFAVATNSCTAALHLALLAMGVEPGDEVITTPITFASTANVIVHVGARPVFCDVQPDTLNLDPAAVCAAVSEATKAIIAVHFAGHPCDMDEIAAIAHRHGLWLLEDSAHAIEATYRERPTGALGHAAAFSFYPTKNITTGEGGMLTTNNEEIASRSQVLSLHGISRDAWRRYTDRGFRHWEVLAPGFKYNMSDVQAALGLAQLAKIEQFWAARERLTERYDARLASIPYVQPLGRREYARPAYHLYVVRVTNECPLTRDQLMNALQESGIGVGVHFRALHLQPYYRDTYGYERGVLPHAETAGDSVLSLPLYPDMTMVDVDRVVDTLARVCVQAC